MSIRFLVEALLIFATWCQVAADPCLKNYGGCDRQHGLCWATSNTTHFCTCEAGYKPVKNSRNRRCVDVNECKEEDVCDENSMCQNTDGSYVCHCRCGYVKDYTGQRCLDARYITGGCYFPTYCTHRFFWWRFPVRFDVRYAKSGYLTNIDSPMFPQKQPSNQRAKCLCESGFRLNNCGFCEDVNECAEFQYKCTGDGSKCVNTEGSYYCECRAGYTLGPCKRQCYAHDSQVPKICQLPRLVLLSRSGISASFSSFASPYIIQNFRWCPAGAQPGNTSVESFDLDGNRKSDVTLTWICTGGRKSVLKNYAEDEAKWDPWTCWTACKPTCWGGLQTRSRTCLHGLPGLKRCMGRGSESRKCYTGPKCAFRVRKDATQLTDAETRDLVQAMRRYKNDPTVRGFRNAASAHGFPGQCDKKECCPHGAKLKFLAWHRTICLNFEEGITRFLRNKSLGLPYWNWLANNPQPPAIAWQKYKYGMKNPFANMTVRTDLRGPMRTIQRDKMASKRYLTDSRNTWTNVAIRLAKIYSLHEFAESLESAHNYPHNSACVPEKGSDRCKISMASIWYAGFDPIFLFHHSQIDRLWAVAQKKVEKEGTTTWTTQTALEALEERGNFGRRYMPFGNKSLNAFPILQAVNNMRDSYYYKELTGVVYDYLGNEGYPARKGDNLALQRASLSRVGGADTVFVSQYLRSIRGMHAVYVNYYWPKRSDVRACSQITVTDTRLGKNILLPTRRRFNNSVPSLVAIKQDILQKVFSLKQGEDIAVVACYTNHPNCAFNCSAASNSGLNELPSPGLLHYLRNRPVDVYKFDWSQGQRMPSWRIDMKSGSQWIYFYGTRASSIFQVSSAKEWTDCNASSGRPFRCSFASGGNACMLPVGMYYLVDGSRELCRKGLRMMVATRF